MFASSVLLSGSELAHTESQFLATTQNVLASGLQAANPGTKIKMRWFVSSQLYVQSCSNRKQARLLIQDVVLLKKEKEENTKTSVQCAKQHFVQLPLKVELAGLIVSLRWHEIATAKLMFPPHLKVLTIILYSFEVFPATFLLLHLHKMSSLQWKADDSCIFWYLWPA